MTYNREIKADKYKPGTDIFFGEINNTPDSLITYYNSATLSTSMQTKLTDLHENFLFENIIDKSSLSYVLNWYTKNNPLQGYKKNKLVIDTLGLISILKLLKNQNSIYLKNFIILKMVRMDFSERNKRFIYKLFTK